MSKVFFAIKLIFLDAKPKHTTFCSALKLPSGLMVPKLRRIDVNATLARHIAVNTTAFLRHMSAGMAKTDSQGKQIGSQKSCLQL